MTERLAVCLLSSLRSLLYPAPCAQSRRSFRILCSASLSQDGLIYCVSGPRPRVPSSVPVSLYLAVWFSSTVGELFHGVCLVPYGVTVFPSSSLALSQALLGLSFVVASFFPGSLAFFSTVPSTDQLSLAVVRSVLSSQLSTSGLVQLIYLSRVVPLPVSVLFLQVSWCSA